MGPSFVIRPKLPFVPGIFDIPAETRIASHSPHEPIEEHLHAHFSHMHIRYGFEIPQQTFEGIDAVGLEVAMAVRVEHRVDCNPIFVAKTSGPAGICLRVMDQDVHWIQNEDVGAKATRLFAQTGRHLEEGFYFAGFRTSDMEERNVFRYPIDEIKRAVGAGLRADQHFQATWREPRDERIVPYRVILYLGDDATDYHTFFELPVVVPIGAS